MGFDVVLRTKTSVCLLLLWWLAAPLQCVFAESAGQIEYEVRNLGAGFIVNDINNNAWIVGKQSGKATLYNGKTIPLVNKPGAPQSTATSINDNAQIVGQWEHLAGKWTGFIIGYAPPPNTPALIDMSSDGFHSSFLYSINNVGRAVGYSVNELDEKCFLSYTANGASCNFLNFSPGSNAIIRHINNNTQNGYDRVGEYYDSVTGIPHVLLISNGSASSPGIFSNSSNAKSSANASAIVNDQLHMVGWYEDTANQPKAFLYESAARTDLGVLQDGIASIANDINNSGQIVGTSRVMNTEGIEFDKAFVYDNVAGMVDLNNRVPLLDGWQLEHAVAINNAGFIVGTGVHKNNASGFLLTPYPSLDKLYKHKLLPATVSSGDRFGTAIDIDGDTMVVGAPGENSNAGAAYVYTSQNGSWVLRSKLVPPEGSIVVNSNYGASVAIHGDTIVVGAPGTSLTTQPGGSVAVFMRTVNDDWIFSQSLLSPTNSTFDNFGISVDVKNNVLAVGAPYDSSKGNNNGAVNLYNKTIEAGWNLDSNSIFNDFSATRGFGWQVSISSSDVIIATSKSIFGSSSQRSEALFIIEKNVENNWVVKYFAQQTGIVTTKLKNVTAFQDTVVYSKPVNTNVASIITKDTNGNWQETNIIKPNDSSTLNFGRSIHMTDNALIIGADEAAYIFQPTGGYWIQRKRLTAPDTTNTKAFGAAVAISGNQVAIGAPSDNDKGVNTGSVYTYTLCGEACINAPSVDLSIVTDGNPNPVSLSNLITYNLVVSNHSSTNAAHTIRIRSKLSTATAFVKSTDCHFASAEGMLSCNIGSLAAGAMSSVSLKVRAPDIITTVSNTFCVESLDVDPVSDNNCMTEDTTVSSSGTPRVQIFSPIDNEVVTIGPNAPLYINYNIDNWVVAQNDSHFQVWIGNNLQKAIYTDNDRVDISKYPGLKTGENTVTLKLVDYQSNPIGVEDSVTFNLKYANPNVSIELPVSTQPIKRGIGESLTVVYTLTDWVLTPGGKSLRWTTQSNGGPVVEKPRMYNPGVLDITDLADGNHVVCLHLMDENEQEQDKACVTFSIVTLNPGIVVAPLNSEGKSILVSPNNSVKLSYTLENWDLSVSGLALIFVIDGNEKQITDANSSFILISYKDLLIGDQHTYHFKFLKNGDVIHTSEAGTFKTSLEFPLITNITATINDESSDTTSDKESLVTLCADVINKHTLPDNTLLTWSVKNTQVSEQSVQAGLCTDIARNQFNPDSTQVKAVLVSIDGDVYSIYETDIVLSNTSDKPSENNSGGGGSTEWLMLMLLIIGLFIRGLTYYRVSCSWI